MNGFNNYDTEVELFKSNKLDRVYDRFVHWLQSQYGFNKSKVIEREFGLKGTEVRALVQMARRASIPVASSEDGYKYARSPEELQSTIRHLIERRDSLDKTIQALGGNAFEEPRHKVSMNPISQEEEIDNFYKTELEKYKPEAEQR
jgi:hypothetical protein